MPRYHFRGQLLSLMRGYSAPCERCSYYGGLVPRWVRERVSKGVDVDDIYTVSSIMTRLEQARSHSTSTVLVLVHQTLKIKRGLFTLFVQSAGTLTILLGN